VYGGPLDSIITGTAIASQIYLSPVSFIFLTIDEHSNSINMSNDMCYAVSLYHAYTHTHTHSFPILITSVTTAKY